MTAIRIALVVLWSFSSAALYCAFHEPQPQRINTAQFVRRSELGMGPRSLNQLANAAIRRALAPLGLEPRTTTILKTSVDSDTGTVEARTEYAPADGVGDVRSVELTLIFHRSVWSLGQITQGISERDKS